MRGKTDPKIERLRQQVIAGEMSVNAALVQAGLRKRSITLTLGDTKKLAKKLAKKLTKVLTENEINNLIGFLSK